MALISTFFPKQHKTFHFSTKFDNKFQFLRGTRAAYTLLAGLMRPAGRVFEAPGLNLIKLLGAYLGA